MNLIIDYGSLIEYLMKEFNSLFPTDQLIHLIYLGMKIQSSINNFQLIEESINFVKQHVGESENQLYYIYGNDLQFAKQWDIATQSMENQKIIQKLIKQQFQNKNNKSKSQLFEQQNYEYYDNGRIYDNSEIYLESKIYQRQQQSNLFIQPQQSELYQYNQTQSNQKKNIIIRSQSHIINCLICLESDEKQIFTLTQCQHIFHKDCLKNYVESIDALPLRCPELQCKKEIVKQDLQQLVDQQLFLKLQEKVTLQYLLENRDRFFICPTVNCNGMFEIKEKKANYLCNECNKSFCSNCNKQSHQGYCNAQQSQILLNRQKQFKQCKNCKTWIERSYGCNHMTCKCKYEFCFNCGQQWKKNQVCNCATDFQIFSQINEPQQQNEIFDTQQLLDMFQLQLNDEMNQPKQQREQYQCQQENNNNQQNQSYYEMMRPKLNTAMQKFSEFRQMLVDFKNYFWSR